MFDLEKEIAAWKKQFRKHSAFDDGAIQESEVHLRDHIEDLIADGHTLKEAFEVATKSFGDIEPVASEEYSVVKTKGSISSWIHLTMMKSYFRIVWRGLKKSPLNSFINIFGLSTSIGIVIFAFSFANWVLKTDQFHDNKEEVFISTYYSERSGELKQFGQSPQALGNRLAEDFSQVISFSRIKDYAAVVKRGKDVFSERIRMVDPAFLEMLTFPLKWGVTSSLEDMNSIILSNEMSIKYFANENPIGQELQLIFSPTAKKVFKVTGVAEKFPESRTIDFDFIVNYSNVQLTQPNYRSEDWNSLVDATLIWVNDPTSIATIKDSMEEYKGLHNQTVDSEWEIDSFDFVSLADIHRESEYIENDISANYGGNYSSIIYMSIVGLLMLILACFNYINIAIVSAAKRLREIGLRKTIGASRKHILWQFLSENLVISGFAMIFGLIIASTVFIPGFEYMFQFDMGFHWDSPQLFIFLFLVILITSFLSGFYPSLYISRFQVVNIMRGNMRFGKKNPVTKILLGLQLILACIFITSAVMFTQNSNYLLKRDWGYDLENRVYVRVDDASAFEKIKNSIVENPNVLSVAGSEHHIGTENQNVIISHEGLEYEMKNLSVDPAYFETMGIRLIAGRLFRPQINSDSKSIVVTEKFVESFGWSDPIDQTIQMNNINYTVIGIVEDFHHHNFQNKVDPTFFTIANENNYQYLSLKILDNHTPEVFNEIKDTWATLFPEKPFDGGYQEEVWGYYFTEIRIHGIVWSVFAAIAVIIAGLGLYGLIALNIEGRIKEFSIRKVLGAGKSDISKAVINQFTILFSISLVVGLPVGFYLISNLIQFAYRVHMPIDYQGLIFTGGFLVALLFLTLFAQIYRVIHMNAVRGLKTE